MARATILFVDDEENVRNALRRAMRHSDYRLVFADGPQSALEMLDREKVEIMVSDYLMPGMNGLDLLKLVRQRQPEIIRIILTGHANTDMAIESINQGEIYRFLTKPWDDIEMQVALHLAWERLILERENRRLVAALKAHEAAFARLRARYPEIATEMSQAPEGREYVEDEPLEAAAR